MSDITFCKSPFIHRGAYGSKTPASPRRYMYIRFDAYHQWENIDEIEWLSSLIKYEQHTNSTYKETRVSPYS